MADVSFFEKHVEKGVLLLCIALLLFSVWYWGLSSPRRVPMHKPGVPAAKIEVPPADADATLKAEAERLKRAHEDEQPTQSPLPKLRPQLDALRATPFKGGAMVAWGQPRGELLPDVPDLEPIDKFGMKVRVAELQKTLPAPSAPIATVNAEVVDNGPVPFEGFVAHPVSTYSLTEITTTWQKMLEDISLRDNPITIVGVEIEVKVADDVNADWDSISAVRLNDHRLPIAEPVGAAPGMERLPLLPPSTDTEGLEAVLANLDLINANMHELLQPRYYDILDAMGLAWVSWQKNLPRDPIVQAGGEITEKIRRLQAAPAPGGGPGRLPGESGRGTPRRPTRGEVDGGPIRGRSSRGTPTRGLPGRDGPSQGVPTRGLPGRGTGRPTARPVRPIGPVPTRTGEQPGPDEGEGTDIVEREIAPPPFGQQQQAGKYLIWFHDMTLQTGKAYRYRVRLKILNPMLGFEGLMYKDDTVDYKTEAWITTMDTPWSAFSAPVRAVKEIDFFLVDSKRDGLSGPKAKTGKVKIAVFTRRLNQLVRQEFVVTKGQPIGGVQDVTLRKPPVGRFAPAAVAAAKDDETHIVRKVDFSTGAVVVNIDFLKRIFPSGRKSTTTEVVFADALGRLRSRLWTRNLPKDSQDMERLKALEAEIASTAPEAETDTD